MRSRVHIRPEKKDDWAAVRAVNEAAFDTPAEGDLVAALRLQARPVVSLVAEEGGNVVGHIMFSPVSLSGHPELNIMGLAPMAVLPGHQGKGIGTAMVRAGIEECEKVGAGAVVVLGHPDYYARFGFISATRSGISCQFDAPEEAFMIMELQPDYVAGASGTIKYHAVFGIV